ncbi:hypothetical protein LRQ04_16985 [Paenarthrobacter sp. AR 02]|uniref:hypothetical protein n=1 Tax=Paenarthrobacter sp. AR 02 TaxID=2899821 RepID=UPI001F46D47C|nr:hypothetical protein [Paenarthrobacter sp. AR 02]MCF3140950.1 hypothetical protein [Paenarthrobacter sp. AR 02]
MPDAVEGRRFWWATQNRNYDDAIEDGTLWTCPRPNDRKLDNSRAFIKELRAGDVVFHHAHSYLRAVSVVSQEWQDCQRPSAYPRAREDEEDYGWLVNVQPIATGLRLHYTAVAKMIEYGRKDAPFHSGGRPAERFLASLNKDEGLRLLAALKVDLPPMDEGFMGRPDHWWGGQDTDAEALARLRAEQAELRRFLLAGRTTANCSMCGSTFPARLLIAGHIKPRSFCTDEERRNFRAVAMLICTMGCDPLFEWGYIKVDNIGQIRQGRRPETPALSDSVTNLLGRHCLAFDSYTAPAFSDHFAMQTRLHPTDG